MAAQKPKRWWRYAVIRGEGLPLDLDGKWFDLDDMASPSLRRRPFWPEGRFEPTNTFEVRDDGEPAVVYRQVADRAPFPFTTEPSPRIYADLSAQRVREACDELKDGWAEPLQYGKGSEPEVVATDHAEYDQ